MKKKLQRISCAVLAFLLAVGMSGVTAQADNASLPPETGNLHIHKYVMDDISNAGAPNDGREITTLPNGAEPLEGITFNVYKINIYDADGNLIANVPENVSDIDPTTLGAATASVTTDKDGLAYFEDLDRGIYYVEEVTNAAVSSPAAPFLVSVPMTDPDTTTGLGSWLTDVHVYPKNEVMSAGKSIGTAGNANQTVDILNSFPWLLDVSVPTEVYLTPALAFPTIAAADLTQKHYDEIDRLNRDVMEFGLYDELGSNLKYVTAAADGDKTTGVTEIKLYELDAIKGTTGTEIPKTATGYNGDLYIVTAPDFDGTNTLEVDFTEEGRRYLSENNIKFVRAIFYTKVILAEDDPYWNAAIQNKNAGPKFTNKNGEKKKIKIPQIPGEIPEIHTGKLGLEKVDANDATKELVGAEFKIARTKADAEAGKYITGADGKDLVAKTDNGSGVYQTAVFYGLAYGATGDEANEATGGILSYWVVETKAPEGYNLLDAPVEVKVATENFVTSDDGTSILYIAKVAVRNTKGFTLPKTGDNMALMLTVAGVLISGAVVLYLVLSKKKKNI